MKTYDQAPPEVHDRVKELIRRFHPDLELVDVRIDILMASTDVEDGNAVTHGGYPAYAVVKILGPKERAMGRGDAEIVIDRDEYEAMEGAKRDALLDHELYHLELKRDKAGRPCRDDHQRPCLKMKKHDFQVGWFHEIARRHKTASIEVTQALSLQEEHRQLYFEFGAEDRLQALRPRGVTSVTVTSGGKGFKVDAAGVHPINQDPESFTEATIESAISIVRDKKPSTSALQRSLNIGYNRAFALMQELERRGIVAPEPGDTGRYILKDQPTAVAA